MERQGIIDKPIGPAEWLSNLVMREKSDGWLHICLDPKYLNEAIKREHHPIPTLEELMPKLCGSTFFSKLHAEQGFNRRLTKHENCKGAVGEADDVQVFGNEKRQKFAWGNGMH